MPARASESGPDAGFSAASVPSVMISPATDSPDAD